VTAALVALCALLFAVTLATVAATAEDPATALVHSLWSIESDDGLVRLGALELTRVWLDGEWWRLATATLLHGSWIHLLLNLSALWSIGEWLEPAVGPLRTLLIFIAAALGGSLASLLWCEAPVVVGASGGILGLAGALLYARVFAADSLRTSLREISAPSLAVMIGLCLALGLVVPMIAQAGHVGGLIAGVLCAGLFICRGARRVIFACALLALFVLGVILGANPAGRTNYHLFLGFSYLDLEADSKALEAFESALASDPTDPVLANTVAYHLALAGKDLVRADELASLALASDSKNPDYLDTKGWIACRAGDPEAGLRLLREAKQASTREIPEILEHLDGCEAAVE